MQSTVSSTSLAAPPRPLRPHTVHCTLYTVQTTDGTRRRSRSPRSAPPRPPWDHPLSRSPLKFYERPRPRQRCLSLRTVFASHRHLP